jgi:hypothetical protein
VEPGDPVGGDQSGAELVKVERLGEVVVGAALHPFKDLTLLG